MSLSNKEAVLRVIEQLPDDASWDEIIQQVGKLAPSGRCNEIADESGQYTERQPETPVQYHLERRGWISVLVPDRPVLPITAETVTDLIEEIRREREDRLLGLCNESDD